MTDEEKKNVDILLKQYELICKSIDEYLKTISTFGALALTGVGVPFFLNAQFASFSKLFMFNAALISIFFIICGVSKEIRRLLKVKAETENKINQLVNQDILNWGILEQNERISIQSILLMAVVGIVIAILLTKILLSLS